MNLVIDSSINNIVFNNNPVQKLIYNGTTVWEKGADERLEPIKFTLTNDSESGTIKLSIGSKISSSNYSYAEWSLDKVNWTRVNNTNGSIVNVETSTLNPGDSVYFRGDGDFLSSNTSSTYYSTFVFSTGLKATCDGNIMSLIGKYENNTIIYPYTFFRLFFQCVGLITGPKLYATTLAPHCYRQMFYGCTSLTTTPALPATTLAEYCYQSMFQGCTSLTTALDLPATTLAEYCYQNMFYGCSNLTTVPTSLHATTTAIYCYGSMFYGCSNLTTAPELPANILTSQCYTSMFRNCSKLNYIKMLATDISANQCLYNWVNGVQTTSGTFIKNTNMTSLSTGVSGIPQNWTVQDA